MYGAYNKQSCNQKTSNERTYFLIYCNNKLKIVLNFLTVTIRINTRCIQNLS